VKYFDEWNKEKKGLEKLECNNIIFHEREIWWCSIGINLGDEQDGKNEMFERPVLVVKKFNRKLAWIVPMSTKEKFGKYYYSLEYKGKVFSIILSQMRLVSIKRFRRFIRKISPHQFNFIKENLVKLIKSH